MFSKLNPTGLLQGEYARLMWVVVPESGVKMETILRPDYWSHVSKQLKPWHRIEVREPGFSWVAELIVRDAGPNWAKVELIEITPFDGRTAAIAPVSPDEYLIAWRASAKWSVMRATDNAIMKEGLATRDEADLWLKHHLAKLAA